MTRERVVRFGDITPLAGVVTDAAADFGQARPWVVLLDSGILHHVGVNRLHVQIARRLAANGYGSLRFDFSGMGDSASRRDDLSFEQSAPSETREALDYLAQAHGARRFVLVGLCSGADVAHLTAVDDERVIGLGLLDPWAYRTRGYWLYYYGSRVASPTRYRNWIQVRWRKLRARLARASSAGELNPDMYEIPQYLRELPPRERTASELQRFVDRGMQMLFIFSGGLEQYNHLGQYAASFPEVDFDNCLLERHVPSATHVFSAVRHQKFVVDEVANWVAQRVDRSAGVAERTVQRTH